MLGDPGLFSCQWIISTPAATNLSAFELNLVDQIFPNTQRASLTRVTRGSMQTVMKGGIQEGKAVYLWTMYLDVMGARGQSVSQGIFEKAQGVMAEKLAPLRATVSSPLTPVTLPAETQESEDSTATGPSH